jgi:hypothetical protein
MNGMNGIAIHEARLNITYGGQNGDLPDPIARDASDGDIKQWAQEAVRGGHVPGIRADRTVSFAAFVVDRFPPNDQRPYHTIFLRPKTEFGVSR